MATGRRMPDPSPEGAGPRVRFGPFTLLQAARKLLFQERALALDEAGCAVLAALLDAAGKPVGEAELVAAVAAAGQASDAALLWACVATLNGVLGACSSEAAYVAHFPAHGFALVVAPARAAPAPMQRPPARAGSLIGCEEALARLGALLLRQRCVTIVAAGGMGKTTLATALAESVQGRFGDGVCFVDLAPMADPRLLPNVLASALGVAAAPGGAAGGLGAYLRDKHLLIVLDSCEHVVAAAAALVEQLLRAAPALQVLATSREPLRAAGEWLYRHGPMRLPAGVEGMRAAQAMAYPAVRLFAERADALGFVLDDANAALVCAVCQRLDGIPLAIELAAARVGPLGVAVAQQLRQRLLSGVGSRRSPVARHRTMAAMLDWSFDLLPRREKSTFARLALYRGEFTLAAATALLADPAGGARAATDATDSVLELIAKSLVVRREVHADCRLRLLDTTRAYASDKLDASGERRALQERHAGHLCRLLEVADEDWLLMSRRQWLERYIIWIDDIRTALDWAFSADGAAGLALQLAAASFSLGHQASLTAEFGERIECALGLLDGAARPDVLLSTRMRALLCNVHSGVASEDGVLRRALATACEAAPDSPLHRYRTALSTGWWAAAFIPGDFPGALERAQTMSLQAREGTDGVMDLVAQRTMSQALHFLGRQAEARALASNVLDNAWRKIPLVCNPSQVDVRVSMRIVLARISWTVAPTWPRRSPRNAWGTRRPTPPSRWPRRWRCAACRSRCGAANATPQAIWSNGWPCTRSATRSTTGWGGRPATATCWPPARATGRPRNAWPRRPPARSSTCSATTGGTRVSMVCASFGIVES